jgi:hypothetical protein
MDGGALVGVVGSFTLKKIILVGWWKTQRSFTISRGLGYKPCALFKDSNVQIFSYFFFYKSKRFTLECQIIIFIFLKSTGAVKNNKLWKFGNKFLQ